MTAHAPRWLLALVGYPIVTVIALASPIMVARRLQEERFRVLDRDRRRERHQGDTMKHTPMIAIQETVNSITIRDSRGTEMASVKDGGNQTCRYCGGYIRGGRIHWWCRDLESKER